MREGKNVSKKWKRITAFLLVSAMLLSSIPGPDSIAADNGENVAEEGIHTEGGIFTEYDDSQSPPDNQEPFTDPIEGESIPTEPVLPETGTDEIPTDKVQPDDTFTDENLPEDNLTEGDETEGTQTLVFEDGSMKVTATAEAGVIPADTFLQVIPVVQENAETLLQYQELEGKLQEKAALEGYSVTGFLAYDITFVNAEGLQIEPNGDVAITIEHSQAAIPTSVFEKQTENNNVTLMYLERYDDGQAEVIDMGQFLNGPLKALDLIADNQVARAEFTDSRASLYTFVWSGTEIEETPDEEGNENLDGEEPLNFVPMTGKIEIIAEDVVLRAEPSIEGEIVEVVPAGTYLELLGMAENDTESWYKALYEGAEVYVRSDMAKVVEEDASEKEEEESEDTPQMLEYENDSVKIAVSEVTEGAIPEGASLRVVPVEPDNANTAALHQEVQQKLEEKAENEEYDITGFLAYDITFVDENGNKLEPDGQVQVSMEYKEAAVPENVKDNATESTDVTVMHLEEDAEGQVAQVVDMGQSNQLRTMETTADKEVQKAEFITESFSVYTITWKRNGENTRTINFHYVNDEGYEVEGYSGKGSINGSEAISLMDNEYLVEIPGYTHKITTIDRYDNTINVWQIMRYKDTFYYNNYSNVWKGSGNKTYDVYFVYERSSGGDSTGEITEKGLVSDKEASVVNENTRTYEIELSAKATGREVGTEAQGASIILVLDRSSSMGSTGISDIQTAAKNFVAAAKEASSISEIAVVWYNGTEGSNTMSDNTKAQGFKTLNSNSNVTQINSFINNASANGGTPMGDALHKAYDILQAASNNNKYVLFFTDGMPGYQSSDSSFNCKTANNAINYASNIKNSNAEIYTIGYKLSGSFTWKEGHSATTTQNHGTHDTTTTAANFLKNKIATDAKHAYTTSNSSGLSNIFEGIAGQLGDPYVIDADKIIDVIDSRFELTTESEAALIRRFGSDLSITKNKDETTTLTWSGEAAKILNELNDGWSVKFEVQAKADFVGGNVIPTNGSNSGIYYRDEKEDKQQMFPQPSVNVKLLTPEVGNEEVTVKQGDIIQSSGFPGTLAPTFNVLELDNQTKITYEELEIAELTETELAKLNAGETVSRDYRYPGTKDVVGHFEFSYEPSSNTPAANVVDHEAIVIGKRAEIYELTATFIPNTVENRKSHLSDIEEPNPDASVGGTPTTMISGKGVYVVNITDPTGGTENKKLESDKSASVVSEAERTFKIDLTAHTTGREEGQAAQGASIVLVLDKSSSMDENSKKLSDIQNAAKAFVDSAAEDSSLSEIAVVWYSGTEASNTVSSNTKMQGFKQLEKAENVNAIKRFIGEGVSANGGTPMGDALQKASDILENASNATKFVLFFTDGMPGYSKDMPYLNCKTANNAVYYATEIKQSAEIYTVGYGLSDNESFSWTPGHSIKSTDKDDHKNHNTTTTGKKFLANYIATDTEHAKTTDSAGGLTDIFNELAGQMGNPYSIQPEKIVDVIDSRYELTTESEASLKAQYGNDLDIVRNADGTTILTWTGSSAKILNVIDGGWNVSFNVQAKEDFVGGNAIPTNGASSGIYVEGSTPKYCLQPSVNVKLLTPEVGDEEITLYKGELIESSGFPGELADTFDVLELDNMTKLSYADLGIEELSPIDAQTLNEGKTVRRDYAYLGTADVVGYFEFSYAPTESPGGNVEDHDATIIGKRVEVYELTVKFVPYTVSEREAQLSDIQIPDGTVAIGGTPVTELSDKGQYVVNVLDKWFIVKRSSSEDSDGNHPLLPDAEFKLSPATVMEDLEQKTYYGKSDEYGILHWYSDDDFTTEIELSDIVYDTYILEETKAPIGYVVSTEKWRVAITATGTIITSEGEVVESGSINIGESNGTAYYYKNTPAYELPSAGGTGIYWYSISGLLLMLAAALILYKNRYKGVLKS